MKRCQPPVHDEMRPARLSEEQLIMKISPLLVQNGRMMMEIGSMRRFDSNHHIIMLHAGSMHSVARYGHVTFSEALNRTIDHEFAHVFVSLEIPNEDESKYIRGYSGRERDSEESFCEAWRRAGAWARR